MTFKRRISLVLDASSVCVQNSKTMTFIMCFMIRLSESSLQFKLKINSEERRLHCSVAECFFYCTIVNQISLLQYDEEGQVDMSTVIPMVDGGTEGFKGNARVVIPGISACVECTLDLYPPQVNRNMFVSICTE
jgi:hypothetical protein